MTNHEEYRQIQERFEGASSLPQLPKSPLALSKMLESADSSPREIEVLILSDPALTAGLLRVASSAFHGRSKPVTTVRESILVLGFRALRSMAIALWTQALIVEASKRSFFDSKRFTKNGSFVGFLSSALYTHSTNERQPMDWVPEEVYAGGVLQNIPFGLLAVLHPRAFNAVYVLAKENNWSLEQGFRSRYSVELAELAPAAAKSLGLPELFEIVISNAHNPEGAMDHFRPMACLHYARTMADARQFGLQRWAVEFAVSGAVLEEIDVPQDVVDQMIDEARRHVVLYCPASSVA
ncbi:MAG: HDOD domain-containing protein [Armatimonadetes bacterium]|nr:HDOD domain-containing protein [Armatimonadota bacterium]